MKEISVVGAAIIENDKLFVVQRSEKMSAALKWEFPGGKIEPGESPEDALIREVYEELNLEIKVKSFIATGIADNGERIIKLHVYEAETHGGSLQLKEHKAYIWIPVEKIMELDWPEADLPACRVLMDKYIRKDDGSWQNCNGSLPRF